MTFYHVWSFFKRSLWPHFCSILNFVLRPLFYRTNFWSCNAQVFHFVSRIIYTWATTFAIQLLTFVKWMRKLEVDVRFWTFSIIPCPKKIRKQFCKTCKLILIIVFTLYRQFWIRLPNTFSFALSASFMLLYKIYFFSKSASYLTS